MNVGCERGGKKKTPYKPVERGENPLPDESATVGAASGQEIQLGDCEVLFFEYFASLISIPWFCWTGL